MARNLALISLLGAFVLASGCARAGAAPATREPPWGRLEVRQSKNGGSIFQPWHITTVESILASYPAATQMQVRRMRQSLLE